METSLIFKTLLILVVELSIVFGYCAFFIHRCRQAYKNDESFFWLQFSSTKNQAGELNLIPIPSTVVPLYSLLILSFVVDMIMIFVAPYSVRYGLMFMTISSVLMGVVLGHIMIFADENDGMRTLKLTIMITCFLGVVAMYSGIDLSPLRIGLVLALLGLILWRIIDSIMNFSVDSRRLQAVFGVILFSVFLLYDFNRLAQLDEAQVNDWNTALEIAISLYLDVLNLLLELLASDN